MEKMFGEVVDKGLSYGQAMHEAIVNGKCIARKGWGGYWYNQQPENPDIDLFTVSVLVAVLKDGIHAVPATPYNEDIQANDWMIVNDIKYPEGL